MSFVLLFYVVCPESAHAAPFSEAMSSVDFVEMFAEKLVFCGIMRVSAVEGALESLDKFDLSAQRSNLVGAAFADGVSTNSRVFLNKFLSNLLNSDIFF